MCDNRRMKNLERLDALLEAAQRNIIEAPNGTLEMCLEKCKNAELLIAQARELIERGL
jgi:hypothetical protein